MKRRHFLVLAVAAAIGMDRAACAQKPMPVVGFPNPASAADWRLRVAAFRRGLAEAGYTEGKNVELVINLKTAKALGLTIPQSLLLRADEIIQ